MISITELARDSLISHNLEQDELFPIREVARLTGVNPVTLREEDDGVVISRVGSLLL